MIGDARTVEVPVSLMERWADDLRRLLPPGTLAIRNEMNALLSQSSTSAGATSLRDFVLDELNGQIDSLDETVTQEDMGRILLELRDAVRDGSWQPAPSTEPRFAPGTTFTAASADDMHRWAVRADGLIVSDLGVGPMDGVDPFTIRNVIPPASEQDR